MKTLNSFLREKFFEKVTTLEVNWLVSQECSRELSNLLYLYPTQKYQTWGYFSFKFSWLIEIEIKRFKNVKISWQEDSLVFNKQHSLVMKSYNCWLVIFGWSLGGPIIINQWVLEVKLHYKLLYCFIFK